MERIVGSITQLESQKMWGRPETATIAAVTSSEVRSVYGSLKGRLKGLECEILTQGIETSSGSGWMRERNGLGPIEQAWAADSGYGSKRKRKRMKKA